MFLHPSVFTYYTRPVAALVMLTALGISPLAAQEPVPSPHLLSLRVELPPGVDSPPPNTVLTLRPAETPRTEPTAEQVVTLEGATSLDLAVPSPGAWELELSSPSLWMPAMTLRLAADEDPTELTLPLWRSSALTGRLVPEDAQTVIPDTVTLRTRFLPEGIGSEERVEAEVRCLVGEGNRFACRVPAAPMDVRIGAKGFIPHYRWDLELSPEADKDLGSLVLKQGASLTGRVEATVGKLTAREVEVELRPRLAPGGHPGTAARIGSTGLIVRPQENGFFQFDGIAPGSYVLEARHPGYAPARMFPIDIVPRSEMEVRTPLSLSPPLSLKISITPAVDWAEQPWRVEVLKGAVGSSNYEGAPVYEGIALADGTLELPDQAPGRFAVTVRDHRGNVFWNRNDHQVETDSDASLWLDLDLVPIEGVVRLGDEALPAEIWFGGRQDSWHSAFSTDDEGSFAGVLPRAGTWRVEVVSETPPIHSFLRVPIPERGSSTRRVVIEIPDTLVTGNVVDNVGRPVSSARVLVESAGDSVEAGTDEEGYFEVRGMPEGRLRLLAGAVVDGKEMHSRLEETTALELQPAGPVLLRLEDMETLAGRVVSERGAVPGALVLVMPPPELGGVGATARTELDGGFVVDVPKGVTRLQVTVLPPGHALKTFEIDTHYGRSIALQVPAAGGTLVVETAAEMEDFLSQRLGLLIEVDGTPLSKGHLHHWSLSHGGHFGWSSGITVPQLAPGHYRACTYDTARSGRGLLAGEGCAAGYLGPGETLTLTLPTPDDEST
jgi:hypothetical protein